MKKLNSSSWPFFVDFEIQTKEIKLRKKVMKKFLSFQIRSGWKFLQHFIKEKIVSCVCLVKTKRKRKKWSNKVSIYILIHLRTVVHTKLRHTTVFQVACTRLCNRVTENMVIFESGLPRGRNETISITDDNPKIWWQSNEVYSWPQPPLISHRKYTGRNLASAASYLL